ncbi:MULTISPECIES: carbohydrate ABC transporter permease [Micromonospora]|uniref:Carbohydrate ABC transporter membrane protein 1, CUT1 family n=1 Tax=Micromonospora yangpuensis TaxID=683228 RepID=A0A1C6URI9_9ACTN|nr:sugar ABC transporter permease [Micromonospora yangpuensis]GGM06832.1 ABC transporter permease [Micromonospora yangpuensis]SCL56692.1 carbohydrate ABC transporter membrane protein 1, CUT1 family [Micromonospora yangpuensis]
MALTTVPGPTRRGDGSVRPPAKRRGAGRDRHGEGLAGYVFLSPWLIGLMGVTAIPMLLSLYLSFTNYDILTPLGEVEWVGLANYERMFTGDPSYWHAVRVTLTFALVAVPLKLAAALGVALLLNRAWRGVGLFRSLFYLPSLLGGSVALAIVWVNMFNRDGAFNSFLSLFGIQGKPWVNDPDWALQTLMVLAIWQFGAPMVIFLAGLKQVPTELYEAASVDGASKLSQFWHVTLPMLSPVIFFNLVLETINGFQGFTAAFVLSNGTGGPVDSTLMYTLNLYIAGFTDLEMGYASAMAWVFLIAIAAITAIFFSTGRFWVHYSDGER